MTRRGLLCLLVLAGAHAAQAQTAAFRGRVIDQATGLAVAGANIDVHDAGARQVSDSSGRFALGALAIGKHSLGVRRLGYRETVDTILVQDGDTVEHVIKLHVLPVSLSQIVVSGKVVQYPKFFENAYKRAASGKGFFFTREDIEQWHAKDFEILFNRVPGVHANDRGVTFQRCQLGLEGFQNHNLRPKVQVYIDGQRITIGAQDTLGLYSVLGSIKPHMIQMMEVYPGVATIPGEFLSDACAVVVIWTKRD